MDIQAVVVSIMNAVLVLLLLLKLLLSPSLPFSLALSGLLVLSRHSLSELSK